MAVCVLVLSEREEAKQLMENLQESSIPISKLQLIYPITQKGYSQETQKDLVENYASRNICNIELMDINNVKLLNPRISQKSRQRAMASWLIPFGFIAGFTFTKMTNLETFSGLGLDPFWDPIIGSFLGMGSGLIGSYFASGSVNPEINDDIRNLRKRSQEGLWLLLLETPLDVDLPWQSLQIIKPIEIVRLRDL